MLALYLTDNIRSSVSVFYKLYYAKNVIYKQHLGTNLYDLHKSDMRYT